MKYLSTFLLFMASLWNCEGYKILAIFPMAARSHYFIYNSLVNGLAVRGHEVTVYCPFAQDNPPGNLTEIPITSIMNVFKARRRSSVSLTPDTFISAAAFVFDLGYAVTQHTLQHEEIQKLLHSNEKYDLVLMAQYHTDALLGIGHHFKAPVALLATMPVFPWSDFRMGNPSPPSYVPNLFSSYSTHMNFWQRLVNSYYDLYMLSYYYWIDLPKHAELVKKYIPGKPDLYSFLNNASLLLVNSHVSSYDAMPVAPNVIEVGGIHIHKPKKLPTDLQKFLDESVNGVIIFSLGSNLQVSTLPLKKRDDILKAFSKLKENVLWKWESDTMPGQPKNVKLMEWLPQSDVTAHPNVKAVINHGGLLSVMECVHYAKPFIGIPFNTDQLMNMAIATYYEYGIELSYDNLDEEKLLAALDQVLNNPKYKANIERQSRIMHDRPMTPLNTAIYWIEYVIRHQGAPHLKYPGADLAWYQRYLVDVVAFNILLILIVIRVVAFVTEKVSKCLCKPVEKKKQQ